MAVSPLGAGAVVVVGVGVVEVCGVVDVDVDGVVGVPVEPLPVDPLLEPEEPPGDADEPVLEADEPPAAAELFEVPELDVVECTFTCWMNGSRWRPESRALLGTGVTVTAGSAGTEAGAAGTGGTWATGTLLLPPLESSTGTAMRARISATATGHSRFSRRSEIKLLMTLMV